uniref:Reverse transcriptase zinc-binding domain-containing protein n=1 Tax=Lactuca sativa TaxID=4236 RepID=A0A9R1VX27_LACSA|nr:hypothetical protein LSAT_V11C300129520 [Lactuca sativa]
MYSQKSLTGVWNNIAGIKKALGKKEISIEFVLSKQHTTNGESWRCCLSSTGKYEVHDLRHRWDYTTSVMDGQISWLKEVPLKVNCFIWRAKMGRIPVAVELARRGVVLENLTCPMCNEYEEDSNHVLVDCSYARSVCEGVSRWCDIQLGPIHTVKDVLGSISQWGVVLHICLSESASKLLFVPSSSMRQPLLTASNPGRFYSNRLEKV